MRHDFDFVTGPKVETSNSGFLLHCVKQIRSFFWSYFPALGLNMERYFVSLRIQAECWKMRTRKDSVFGHCSRSASCALVQFWLC